MNISKRDTASNERYVKWLNETENTENSNNLENNSVDNTKEVDWQSHYKFLIICLTAPKIDSREISSPSNRLGGYIGLILIKFTYP